MTLYGTLERVIASSHDAKITSALVEEVIGAPKNTVVNSLVSAIADKKWSEALSLLRRASEDGGDMTLLSKLLIVKLRAILMLSIDPKADFSKTFSEEDIEKFCREKSAAGKNIFRLRHSRVSLRSRTYRSRADAGASARACNNFSCRKGKTTKVSFRNCLFRVIFIARYCQSSK